MKIIEAINVFTKLDFQEDTDYQTYPVSIYDCPVCNNKLSFNRLNFKKYTLNKESLFSKDEQRKITSIVNSSKREIPNSFLEFYCPKCNSPSRLYFTAWAGGHYTAGFHLEFIIIDTDSGNASNRGLIH